jgi:serine/threonine protein kinase
MNNVPQFIDSNIPDSVKEISKLKEPLWTIISYSPGCTLMKLIEDWTKDTTDIQPIESIRFCQELLKTVKCIHSKETIHRDIKPANIIVDCDKHQLNRICSQCKLTLIDYGLAYIRTETNDPSSKNYRSSQANDLTLTALQEDIGHSWCRVPQLAKASDLAIRQMTDLEKYEQKQLRRSPTTDASSVCAILFTLLTKEHPGSTRTATGLQPHHKCEEKLQNLIKKSLTNTGNK